MNDNFDYMEREDELDTVLKAGEGFDVFENLGVARPKKKIGEPVVVVDEVDKIDETKVTTEGESRAFDVNILKNNEDEDVDVIGGGYNGNAFWGIASSPDEEIAGRESREERGRQNDLLLQQDPADVQMSFGRFESVERVSDISSIMNLLPTAVATGTAGGVGGDGAGSNFDASVGSKSNCPACNGRSTNHRCGKRYLPGYAPSADSKPKKKAKTKNRCGLCAGCRRKVNCGRCIGT